MKDYLSILTQIRNKNKIPVFIICIISVLSLGVVDYYTGHELVFAIFYLIIISLSILFADIYLGVFISILSASVGLWVDISYPANYTSVMFPILNNTFRLCYYILHTMLIYKLLSLYRQSRELSLIDPLTKINNYRSFQIQLQHEINKSHRTQLPLSIVYFDIDNFKSVNDNYGHSTGDFLLQTIAGCILKIIRPDDVIARLGGDEFALLLPETDYVNAEHVINRIQREVLNVANTNKWPISLSIGVVIFKESSIEIDEMIKIADELMYQVKNEGKNNIKYKVYPDEISNKTGL